MRLLYQILFVTLLPLLIVLSFNYYQNLQLEKILNDRLDHKIKNISHNIEKELQTKEIETSKVSQLLSKDKLIVNAVEKRDIDSLYTKANMFTHSKIITEVIFIDKKGSILSRASDEFHFNDSIKNTDLQFLLKNTKNDINKIIYFDHKYQLVSIEPIYKYDINLVGYVVASQIIDKEFLNSLSTEHLYLEFKKNGIIINNFDKNHITSLKNYTKFSLNSFLSLYLNIKGQQKEILDQKSKQTYIILFLLILSGIFIFFFIGKVLKPFNQLNKLLLEFSSQKLDLKELIYQLKGGKNINNEFGEIQKSIILTLEKLDSTQDALIESNEKTLHANRLKDKFLANMSHKIRTPMNEIISFIHLLEKTDPSSKQEKYIQKTFQSTETLSDVINNILDIAKIESGELELNQHYTTINKIAKEYNKKYKQLVSSKKLDYIVNIDEDLFLYQINIDHIRFNQAIGNIIDNAIKFTNSGFIRISIEVKNKKQDEQTIDLNVKIKDTGMGIQKKNLEKIFDSFTILAHDENDNIYPGAGLGLSLSKQIITKMDGTIKVSSKLNEGSTFTVSLPNIKYK